MEDVGCNTCMGTGWDTCFDYVCDYVRDYVGTVVGDSEFSEFSEDSEVSEGAALPPGTVVGQNRRRR